MSRKKNFEEQEIGKLLSIYKENSSILNAKFTNAVTNKKKKQKWEELTNAVNAIGKQNRTTDEMKHKWKDLLSRAKKDFSNRKHPKTGGGPKPPESPYTYIVLDIIGETSPVLSGISTGGESALDNDTGNVDSPSQSRDTLLDPEAENDVPDILMEPNSSECSRKSDSPKLPPKKKIKRSDTKPTREELHSELLQAEIKNVQVETEKLELEKTKIEKEIVKLDLDIWLLQQQQQIQQQFQQQQLFMQQQLQQQQQQTTASLPQNINFTQL